MQLCLAYAYICCMYGSCNVCSLSRLEPRARLGLALGADEGGRGSFGGPPSWFVMMRVLTSAVALRV